MVDPYLNYDRASVYSGFCVRTLAKAVADREVVHLKRGRRVLFRRADLDEWLNQFAVKAIQSK